MPRIKPGSTDGDKVMNAMRSAVPTFMQHGGIEVVEDDGDEDYEEDSGDNVSDDEEGHEHAGARGRGRGRGCNCVRCIRKAGPIREDSVERVSAIGHLLEHCCTQKQLAEPYDAAHLLWGACKRNDVA